MKYVATTPINHKTGKAGLEFGKITRKIYECKDIQEALIVESNLNAIEDTGYVKIYNEYPTFKKSYNIDNFNIKTAPQMYERIEDMNLTDID